MSDVSMATTALEQGEARGVAARVLFVGRTLEHFSYYSTVIAALLARGAHVELLLDEEWSKHSKPSDHAALAEFREDHPDLLVDWLVRRSDRWRETIFALRELRSYRSYLVRRPRPTSYYVERWRNYLSGHWLSLSENWWFRGLLSTPPAGWALSWAEAAVPADPDVMAHIGAKRPDVVVVSPMNMRFSEETDYVKAAQRLGLRSAVQVLSWDNLTTKGLLQIKPDALFVWNEWHRQEARTIHGIPDASIRVTGAPFMDKWFAGDGGAVEPRDAFCARLGFDLSRPILLYVGSHTNIATDETDFVRTLRARLSASKQADVAATQVLLRPHPSNHKIYRNANIEGVLVWPDRGALPQTRDALAEMRASLRHATAVVGINTSSMVDAVLANRPTCSVKLEQYADTQWNSAHFAHLRAADALYFDDSLDEFEQTFAALLAGHDPRAERRQEFARIFARPSGTERSAGGLGADAILQLVRSHGRR
jgi:hypothetical protein